MAHVRQVDGVDRTLYRVQPVGQVMQAGDGQIARKPNDRPAFADFLSKISGFVHQGGDVVHYRLHGKPKRPIRTIKRRGDPKRFGHGMTHRLAIYDMDRTVTFTGTYTGFLIHVAKGMAPWRLALFPGVILLMLAYVLKLISRQRLKELNQALMIGFNVERARLKIGRAHV